MKHPIQSNPIQFGKIRIGMKYLLLLLSLLCFQFANSQPPPENPPGDMEDYPFDNPVVLQAGDDEGTIRFETINNTQCSAEFANWFHVGLREKSTGNISPIYFKEIEFGLGSGQSGSVTNFQLFTMWELPNDYDPDLFEYVILGTGVYLKFGGMSGYMTLYPNSNGTQINIPGNTPPCDCFIPTIVSNGTKITLTLNPCP
jgi:hypothetical protein